MSAVILIDQSPGNTLVLSEVTLLQNTLQSVRTNARTEGVPWRLVVAGTPVVLASYQADVTNNVWILDERVTLDSMVELESNALADSQVVFDEAGTPFEDSQSDLPSNALGSPLAVSRSLVIRHTLDHAKRRQIAVYPDIGFVELVP